MNTIDVRTLVCDLKTTATLLTALRQLQRTAGHRTTSLEARDRRDLKARATRLCCLRAHLRGKVHLRTMTFEQQAVFVDEEAQRYCRRAA
jgi:hypothetical protein